MSNKPRILALDIETKPAIAYVWRMWDENIGVDQLIAPGGTICVGAKWIGEKDMMFFSDWQDGHVPMLEAVHALMEEADAIVTYNGDKFDLPKLRGEFVLNGLRPPAPPTSIDVVKTVKKLGFDMARLAFIGPLLNVGKKVKHEGFPLWEKVMSGDAKAQRKMEIYCKQDVRVLERLYQRIKPFIVNHPHMALTKGTECGVCNGSHLHSRGYRRTKSFKIQRLQCQDCGSWQDGKREKVT